MAHCDEADLNGDLWVVGSEGELEEKKNERVIYIPNNCPAIGANGAFQGLTREHVDDLFRINLRRLRGLPNPPDLAVCAKIAYLRVLVYRNRLLRPDDEMDAHHLHYNEVARVPMPADGTQGFADIDNAAANALYDAVPRVDLRKKFTNMLCCVAFMFRQRGHHYLQDFEARYNSLWRKCLYNEDNPGLSWEHIAHTATHAVWPRVLDDFWLNSVMQNRCAGALKKRIDCSPAGSAAPITLHTSVRDLVATFPQIKVQHAEDLAWLDGQVALIAGPDHRWSGSVNNIFYRHGQVNLPHRVDEARLASLTSKLIATVKTVDPANALCASKALQRLASAAPITGGVFGMLVSAQITYIREKGSKLMAGMGGAPLLIEPAHAPAPAAAAGQGQ